MTSVLVYSTGSDVTFERLLSSLVGAELRFVPELAAAQAALQSSDLFVRICPETSDDDCRVLSDWLRAARVPWLQVEVSTDELSIGPLTLSGRACCGYCARARRLGASAELNPTDRSTLGLNLSAVAGILATELRTLIDAERTESHLLDHVIIHDLKAERFTRHRIIPLPWCDFCGRSSSRSGPVAAIKFTPEDPPEAILRNLGGWVDARTGVISRIEIDKPSGGREVPVIATAVPPHVSVKSGCLRRLPLGWGKGLTLSGALLSAIGEAIERYSASLPDPLRIVWARCDELGEEFLDPREFAIYSDAQYERQDFPYVRFDPTAVHGWVRGAWADDQRPVWVPVMLVFLYVTYGHGQLFCQGTSNGLAASTNAPDAALRALLELVERDALMTAWMTGYPGQQIELDETLDPRLREVLDGIEDLGAKVEVYALPTSAYGSTVLCLALGDGIVYPGVTVGMAAGLDVISALRQAILELGQTGPHLRRVMHSKLIPIPEFPQAVREMPEHAIYYFPVERVRAFAQLRSDTKTVKLRDLTPIRASNLSLESFVSGLKKAGIRVAFVDVTSPDVATSPFRVVRAISPDLQPLSYGFGLDFAPVARVRRLGLASEIQPIHPIS